MSIWEKHNTDIDVHKYECTLILKNKLTIPMSTTKTEMTNQIGNVTTNVS